MSYTKVVTAFEKVDGATPRPRLPGDPRIYPSSTRARPRLSATR